MHVMNTDNAVSIQATTSDVSITELTDKIFMRGNTKYVETIVNGKANKIPLIKTAHDVNIKNKSGNLVYFKLKLRDPKSHNTYYTENINIADKEEWASAGILVEDILFTNTQATPSVVEVYLVGTQ